MASSSSEIINLTQSRPEASAIPKLQGHVVAQAKGEAPYMFDSCRMLVKLLQLFPDAPSGSIEKQESIALACLLALRQYPTMTDFLALLYMIPPNIASAEPCATIQACADALDACQYRTFWTNLDKLKSCEHAAVASLAQQSDQSFRAGILSVLALTYRQAPSHVVLAALQVSSLEEVKSLQHESIESTSTDAVTFQPTTDNSKREHVFQESIGFGALTSLMTKLSQ